MNPLIENIYNRAKANPKKIVLPESNDSRIEEAVKIIRDQKLAEVITNLPYSQYQDQFIQTLFELRKDKGMTIDLANKLVKNPLYFGTLMVYSDLADGMVAGANNTTLETLRPALQIIKTKPESSLISTFFIMDTNNPTLGENGIIFFADCGLNINPTAKDLSEIAQETAKSFENLFDKTPKIAMLSYSTNGSGQGESVDKVKTATQLVKKRQPKLLIEGEIQADAAIISPICRHKSPQSHLDGQANILIFPDLNSGNIAYKLVERIGKVKAFGPITQGIKKPINDLSRGCSIDDIVTTVAITSVQS